MSFDGTAYYNSYVFEDGIPKYSWEADYDANRKPPYRAQALLEKMLCDIHIAYTHYYIMDDIFHMFEAAMDSIRKRDLHFESSVEGNYSGTFIEVECIGDDY